MWGLGLNGNPISDLGVGTLARALAGRASLRDIGITLSDVTDVGIQQLADSVTTCKHLRFIYLYTSGFKAATKITDAGKVRAAAAARAHAQACKRRHAQARAGTRRHAQARAGMRRHTHAHADARSNRPSPRPRRRPALGGGAGLPAQQAAALRDGGLRPQALALPQVAVSGAADPRRRRRRRHDTTRKEKTLSATVAATSARAHARNDLKISTTLTYYAASSRRGAASSSLHDTRCAGASPPSADHPPHPPITPAPAARGMEGWREGREGAPCTTPRPLRDTSSAPRSLYEHLAEVSGVRCATFAAVGQRVFGVPSSPAEAAAAATTLPRVGVRVGRAHVRVRAYSQARACARARPRAYARKGCACPSSRRGGPRTPEKI